MKRLWASAFLLLGSVCVAQAQVNAPALQANTGNAAPEFAATSAAKAALLDSLAVADSLAQPVARAAHAFAASTLTTALPAEPAAADPATPSPKPKFIYGGRDDYRWQLSLAATWVRFRSSVFNASAV